jgi:hypothetical protein
MTPTLRNILIPVLIIIAFVGIALGVANYRKQSQDKDVNNGTQEAPDVTVTSPLDQEKVSGNNVTVRGETDSKNIVSVNNEAVTVNEEGSFEKTVALTDKENLINIEVTDPDGNKTIVERMVIREISPSELSQTGPETALFIASLAILGAYLIRRRSEEKIVESLKKF